MSVEAQVQVGPLLLTQGQIQLATFLIAALALLLPGFIALWKRFFRQWKS